MDKFTAYLQSITELSEIARQDVQESIVTLTLEKKQRLLRQGQVCNYLCFVEAGLLRQFYHDGEKEVTDYFAFENKLASGIGSLFSRKPGKKIIEALEPSTLLAISHQHLQQLFLKHHDVERVGRIIAIDAFVKLEERIYSLQFHSAKRRYDDLLTNNPTVLQRVPLGQIASYLGITQVTLSRIRGQQ
jgi:CRP-like cAMP-binding protein